MRTRRLRRGEALRVSEGSVLHVLDGVLALSASHSDGAEALLGPFGAGHTMVDHPDDHCDLALVAQTKAEVAIEDWDMAVRRAEFPMELRRRVRLLEAWSAMQAHPHLEQRIIGILSLLAEDFGRPHAGDTLIDVRVTHAQIAAAVGAARTTVTRTLGRLRRQGVIDTHRDEEGERICLRAERATRHG